MTELERAQARLNLRFYRIKLKYQKAMGEDTRAAEAMIKELEKQVGRSKKVGA